MHTYFVSSNISRQQQQQLNVQQVLLVLLLLHSKNPFFSRIFVIVVVVLWLNETISFNTDAVSSPFICFVVSLTNTKIQTEIKITKINESKLPYCLVSFHHGSKNIFILKKKKITTNPLFPHLAKKLKSYSSIQHTTNNS